MTKVGILERDGRHKMSEAERNFEQENWTRQNDSGQNLPKQTEPKHDWPEQNSPKHDWPQQNGPKQNKPGEVDQMTAVLSDTAISNAALSTKQFHDVTDSLRIRSTGFARIVMSISLTMFNWAASRADRDIRSPAERAQLINEARARASREHYARLMQMRIR